MADVNQTSPSFAQANIAAPPSFTDEMTDSERIELIHNFLGSQYVGLTQMQNSIASGWLISTLRVLDLDAGTITAGTIFTQDLYIGTDGNGGIRLGGSDSQIEITDSAGVTRFLAGNIGSDVWIQLSDATGAVKFQSGTTTYIDGAIIQNATLFNAAFPDTEITGGKMVNNTVTDTQIGDVSASTINAGVLNVDGAPSAINITSTGAINLSAGGDINSTALGTDFTFHRFYNSSSVEMGSLVYNGTTSSMQVVATGGQALTLLGNSTGHISLDPSGGIVFLGGDNADDIRFSGLIDSNIALDNHNTFDLAATGARFADGWFVDLHYSGTLYNSDLMFDNGIGLTEPDKVWSTVDPSDGLVWMNQQWEPIRWMHKDGTEQITNLPPPDVPQRTRAIHEAEKAENLRLHRERQAAKQTQRQAVVDAQLLADEPNRLARVKALEDSINEGKQHQAAKSTNTAGAAGKANKPVL